MNNHENVNISVKLTGNYPNIIDILGESSSIRNELAPLYQEIDAIAEATITISGGTRSAIAEEAGLDLNPKEIANILSILQRHGLVRLEGNTWFPTDQLKESI